jgi:hypothetical protein
VDPQGNAVAVWQLWIPNQIVQGAVRPTGGAWRTPTDLSAAGQDVQNPQVAVDRQGNAVAVWQRYNGTDKIVQGAVRPTGGAWQTPTDLSAAGQFMQDPQVAMDAHGNAVAVWWGFKGRNYIVQSVVRPAGGAWQAPVDLSAAGQDASSPQVRVNAQGNAVAVWRRFNGTNWIVTSAVHSTGGAWQAPIDLSATGQNVDYPGDYPQVAVDAQDNAVAVWSRSNGTNYIVQSAATA